MRTTLSLAVIALALCAPVHGDGEPCFVGTPSGIKSMRLTEASAVSLSWTVDPEVDWYEVMRCDASAGPCSLLSLTTTESPAYIDDEADASTHLWYRIIARTEPASDLCAYNEYCSLSTGQCAGEGRCSLYSELCPPEFYDPVCGCSSNVFQNACFACAGGENIRWWGSCWP